ncbi:MAG: DUF6363 domain-containing protein, partial [Lachnospiraceae bacterium]
MRARQLNYNQHVAYVRTEEAKGRAFVSQPEAALHISRACRDAGELMRVYELGRGAALRRMVELKRFLEE